MFYKVLGVEIVDYESKKTGRPVKGTNLHCTYPTGEGNRKVVGERVERLYVPERVYLGDIAPGDMVDVYFNRYGSVDSVSKTLLQKE